jgi:hypothetical protein
MKWKWTVGVACVVVLNTGIVSAEKLDIFRMNVNEYAAVLEVTKAPELDGYMFFILQQSYRIEGKDMGYSKPVGSIKRLFGHMCGTQSARLAITNVEDMGGKTLQIDAPRVSGQIEPITVPLTSDSDLLRAARYICGDASAKHIEYQGPAKGNPRDDKVLSCTLGAGNPIKFTINEPAKTVNNGPAIFSSRTIKFPLTEQLRATLTIDRFSGALSILNHTDNAIFGGQCEQVARRKF